MKTSLAVALVTETYPPEVNGVAMTLGRMVAGLRQLGHRVTVFRPRQRQESDETDILLRGCPLPGYRGLRFGLPARGRLLRAWRRERPDIVQVATEGPLGASAIAAARRLGIPVVSEFHTNFHAYSRHYGFGWLEGLIAGHLRRLHNRSRFALVPTTAIADELSGQGYRSLRVISRGVDTLLFTPARRSAALRAQWGATEADLVVAYVGRIAPEKNLPLVLRAFAAISQARPDAKLLFVGDGPARKRLEAEHPQHLYAGMRRGEELAMYYASADLFLFPSLTETFGNVTAEALASGLAVLAYDHAAAAELIRDGDNGMLVQPGDDAAYLAAALRLATDAAAQARIRAQAAQSVAHLDWQRICEQLVAVFREAIDTPPESQPWRHGELAVTPD